MTAPTIEQVVQCPRCLKMTSGVHTCTPTEAWRKLEAENAALRADLSDADKVFKNLQANYVDLQKALTETKAANAALRGEVDRLRTGFDRFIGSCEECTDQDGWLAFMCSADDYHEAQSVLEEGINDET